MRSKLRRSIASVLLVSVLTLGLQAPAQAGTVSTDAAVDRERLATALDRQEVRARLAKHGVDLAEAQARVAALTDAEAARLAAGMETLPAGAGGGDFFVVALVAFFFVEILPVILIAGLAVVIAKSVSANRSGA